MNAAETLIHKLGQQACNVTSKIDAKVSAVTSKPENYLDDFGIEPLQDSNLVCAEKYLVRVISPKSNCKAFDNPRYDIYKTKGKALNELPTTSSTITHHYAPLAPSCLNLLDSCSKILEPANYGWIIVNTSLKDVVVRRDVQRIVDVRGHTKSSLQLYCNCTNCDNV